MRFLFPIDISSVRCAGGAPSPNFAPHNIDKIQVPPSLPVANDGFLLYSMNTTAIDCCIDRNDFDDEIESKIEVFLSSNSMAEMRKWSPTPNAPTQPESCAAVLRECFSGEDTAEVMTPTENTGTPTNLSPTSGSSHQSPAKHASDFNVISPPKVSSVLWTVPAAKSDRIPISGTSSSPTSAITERNMSQREKHSILADPLLWRSEMELSSSNPSFVPPHSSNDEGKPDEEEEEELSWRMSPHQSMSDWTIEVMVPTSARSTLYHVHKSVLAVGPRRSQYFVKLFRATDPTTFQKDATPPSSTTTRLEMEELTATAFPVLLDYVYDHGATIHITTYNATALHVLSQRLEMKHLRGRVREFWIHDISMDHMAIYYQHATKLGGLDDPLILRALEVYCAQHLFDSDSGKCTIADLLDLIDPQFLFHVIQQAFNNTDDQSVFSLRLSLIVAVYCNIHYLTDLDQNMFYKLTDAQHLPVIESQAAKAFLELQEKISSTPNASVSSLTERCISVLSEQWDEACVKQDRSTEQATVVLPKLVGTALERFVSKSLMNAKDRLSRSIDENSTLQRQVKESESAVSDLQLQVDTAQQTVESLERQNEQLQRQLRDLQREKDELQQQMKYINPSSTKSAGKQIE
jgi:BTB/POZ domain